ncbi:MAG: glycosyltransferase family 4 protein [Candidatus Xenobia bacterium]
MMTQPYRLAVLISHPIQYFTPLYQRLARCPELDIQVYFCARDGAERHFDAGFAREVQWDVPLLDGYPHQFLRNDSPWPSLRSFWGLLNPSVAAVLWRTRPHVLWVHGWGSATTWMAIATALAIGVPVLMRGDTNPRAVRRSWKMRPRQWLLRRLFSRLAGFLAAGQRNHEFYLGLGVPASRIHTVPYAVDNARWQAEADRLRPQRRQLRERWGLPADVPLLLYCGRLAEEKGVSELLAACRQIQTAGALVVVGDGPLRALLEGPRGGLPVYWMGFKNQSELAQFYVLADALVVPSRFEPWGLVINEAMVCGLPVLATDVVGAVPDLVTDGVTGLVFPAGSTDLLAQAMERMLRDPVSRAAMGAEAAGRIAKWSYEQDVEAILACLEDLARQRLNMAG